MSHDLLISTLEAYGFYQVTIVEENRELKLFKCLVKYGNYLWNKLRAQDIDIDIYFYIFDKLKFDFNNVSIWFELNL